MRWSGALRMTVGQIYSKGHIHFECFCQGMITYIMTVPVPIISERLVRSPSDMSTATDSFNVATCTFLIIFGQCHTWMASH